MLPATIRCARHTSNDVAPTSMRSLFGSRKQNKPVDTYTPASTAPPTRRPGSTNGNAFVEPPPAYTESAPITAPALSVQTAPPASAAAVEQRQSSDVPAADDKYSFLRTFDTIFLIDDSGSMAGGRWRQASAAIEAITPICTSHDADGIDIHFLNAPDSPVYSNVQLASTVHEIFSTVKPGGSTPTGQRLRAILTPYLRRYEANPQRTKPINLICITDGEAQDDVESPLIEAAKKLDALGAPAWQIGVQFFQIGNDPEATEMLKYLDDELANAAGGSMRDIVDTVPYKESEGALTADGLLKVVLGSVNRRLDRRKA